MADHRSNHNHPILPLNFPSATYTFGVAPKAKWPVNVLFEERDNEGCKTSYVLTKRIPSTTQTMTEVEGKIYS